MKKGGLAAAALAVVALAAWRAPEAHVNAAPARPTVAVSAGTIAAPVSSYAPVVERVMPAVVTIRVEKRASMVPTGQQIPEEFRRFFGDQRADARPARSRGVERGLGSGVIVSHDGYILTNNHVVDGADEIKSGAPDGRTFTAKVVGTDKPSDLAVVKIVARSADARARRLRRGPGGRRRPRGRQPARHRRDGDDRDHQREGPDDARRRQLRGLPPDRRADQPWQLRRRAGEHQRQLIGINSQILSPAGRQHRASVSRFRRTWQKT